VIGHADSTREQETQLRSLVSVMATIECRKAIFRSERELVLYQ